VQEQTRTCNHISELRIRDKDLEENDSRPLYSHSELKVARQSRWAMLSRVLLAILFDFSIDLCSIVVVVRERVVDLSEREVRKFFNKFLRRTSMLEYVNHDRANRKTSTVDNGTLPANGRIVRDMRVGNFGHLASPRCVQTLASQ
jgi:hypothetical protein